jgi:fibro-slime domain-containing protein
MNLRKKRLVVAIQSAILTLAVGQVTAEPLTADGITQLDETTISEVQVGDVPLDLSDDLLTQVADFENLSGISPELAQYLIDNDITDPPLLTAGQVAALADIISAASGDTVEIVVNADGGIEVMLNGEPLTDLDTLTDEQAALLVEQAASLDDLSAFSAEQAQFLIEHNTADPAVLSSDQVAALEAIVDASGGSSDTVELATNADGGIEVMLNGEPLTDLDTLTDEQAALLVEQAASLDDLSAFSAEQAQFLIEHNTADPAVLSSDQVAALEAIVDASGGSSDTVELATNADGGIEVMLNGEPLTDLDTLTDEQAALLVEQAASLDDLSAFSAEQAQFLIEHNTADPAILNPDQVAVLEEIINPQTQGAEQAIAELTPEMLPLIEVNNGALMIGGLAIPTDLVGLAVEKISSFDLSMMPPELAQFLLDYNQTADPAVLTPEQVATLEEVVNGGSTGGGTGDMVEIAVSPDGEVMVMVNGEEIVDLTTLTPEQIPLLLEEAAGLSDFSVLPPKLISFLLDHNPVDSPILSPELIVALEELLTQTPPPPEGTDEEAPDMITWTGIVRDFSKRHPDFEAKVTGLQSGCVEKMLGANGKPIVIDDNSCEIKQFDWYSDDIDASRIMPFDLPLNKNDQGLYTFDSNSFFPADKKLGGNEGLSHNYHFTYEVHGEFTYQPGQIFNFRGDDDVWVFINNQLVVDLGGVHSPEAGKINLDELDLTPGETYPLDLFFAERHTVLSNFKMETGLVLGKTNPVEEINLPELDANAISQISIEIVIFLRAEDIARLKPETLPGITKEQVAKLTPEAWKGFTPETIVLLAPEAIGGLSKEQLAQMPDELKDSLTEEQKANLTSDDFEVVIDFEVAGLTADAVAQLSLEKIAEFSAEMVAEIPVDAMIGFSAEQLAALPLESWEGFKPEQIARLNSEALAALTVDHLEFLAIKVFVGLGTGANCRPTARSIEYGWC